MKFYPDRGTNQVTTPGAVSASVAINAVSKAVRVVNSGANICYVRVGSGAQTANTSDTPVRSGESIILGKGDGDDTLAHISAAGTTLHVQTGEGSED